MPRTEGSYAPRALADRIRATLVARPVILRVMRAHFADVCERAETRADRSRVFAQDRSGG
jgi:hypothetical protein